MELRLASIDDLIKHKKELVEMMDYSVRVNQGTQKREGTAKYDKLIGYFEQGKANVWLAFAGNSLLGYAQYFKKENGRVHLNEIAVDEHAQGMGIGTELLQAVEKSATEMGTDCVELFCNEVNASAKSFYDKHLYSTEKRLLTKRL